MITDADMKLNYDRMKFGTKGEQYIKTIATAIWGFDKVEDDTESRVEGDFFLCRTNGEKKHVEIKADAKAFNNDKPSFKLPIELKDSTAKDGKGWFYKCEKNNIDGLIFVFYGDRKDDEPLFFCSCKFDELKKYIYELLESKEYVDQNKRKAHNDSGGETELLCVQLENVECNVQSLQLWECSEGFMCSRMSKTGFAKHLFNEQKKARDN